MRGYRGGRGARPMLFNDSQGRGGSSGGGYGRGQGGRGQGGRGRGREQGPSLWKLVAAIPFRASARANIIPEA